jgi:cell division cycle protein 20 (cofactor of APC complex)
MSHGQYLATGDEAAKLTIYDVNAGKKVRSLSCHSDRISALAWNHCVVTSGSRDSTIVQHDIRTDHHFLRCAAHEQEVCGLKWSNDLNELASGGNDNKINVWDMSMGTTPRLVLTEHKAAVKALAWCPWKSNVLASGAGSSDKYIKIWSTVTGDCISSVETGSQVCALEWNKYEHELLSAHGYVDNQLTLWKYPDMTKVTDYIGHSDRVLCMA